MIYVGIDPGQTGWIVALGKGMEWLSDARMPATATELADVLIDIGYAATWVERQHPVRGQGLGSTYTTAYHAGVIEGVIAALGRPYYLVRAADWQRVMLRGEPRASCAADLKRQYVAVAERMFPGIGFRGPRGGILDGKAAAALIAAYGMRMG